MSKWVEDIGPIVEPPAISDLFTNFCTGTPAFLHISSYTEEESLSEVYLWLALILITGPLFIRGLFLGSCFSPRFGCTA